MKGESEEETILRKYAKEAKNKILYNKYLYEKLKFFSDYNKVTKDSINKFISLKNKDQLLVCNNYKNLLKLDNINLQKEYEKANIKFNSLLDICVNDIPLGKPILLEEKKNNFYYEFIIKENDNLIKALNKSINQSKKHAYSRERERDNLVEKEKGDKEMEKYVTYIQNTMLFELKKCNEFKEKINYYNCKKQELMNNINLLNKYISNKKPNNIKHNIKINEDTKIDKKNNKKPNAKFTWKSLRISKRNKKKEFPKEMTYDNSKDKNDKGKIRENKGIIKEFIKISNLFETSIPNIEMDQEIHDDEDTLYENRFANKKQLSINYINNIHKSVSKLNTGLIKYNQQKPSEIDVYSLQRRRFEHKSLKNQIKEMEQKKEKILNRLNNLKNKYNELKKLNEDMNYNYKSIKLVVNQNNTISGIEPDLIKKSLNIGQISLKKRENKEEIEGKENGFENQDKKVKNFLDELEEIEEEEIIDVNDKEKSDEKKETKETKKYEEEKTSYKINFMSTRKFLVKKNKLSNKSSIRYINKKNSDLKRSANSK